MDEVIMAMARTIMARGNERPPHGPGTESAIRDLGIEALREEEMIAEYIKDGLIKFNTDPSRKVWEIDKSVPMGEVGLLHDMGIYVLINRFGIDPDQYFKSK